MTYRQVNDPVHHQADPEIHHEADVQAIRSMTSGRREVRHQQEVQGIPEHHRNQRFPKISQGSKNI
jgi:hypothetical protein